MPSSTIAKTPAKRRPSRSGPEIASSGESTYRTIFETAGSAIIVFGPEGHIREFNPAAERLHGCRRDDVVGKRYTELFVPEETRTALRRELQKMAALDSGRDLEIAIQAADGCSRVICWNGTRLRDDDGTPTGMIAIGQDVTARRHAEQALRESEQRFRALADAAPVLVWMADEHYQCTYVNQAWLEFTGLPTEALLGEAWMTLVHPDDHDRRWSYYIDAVERRVEFTLDHRLRAADGSYRWIYGTASPRFSADGSFIGFVGCSIDISVRRQAEQALQRANDELERTVARRTAELSASVHELRSEIADRKEATSRLESVMQNSPDFIFRTGRDGHITFLNRVPAGEVDDIVDTSMYDWILEESHARLDAALSRVFDHGLTDRYEAGVCGGQTIERGTPFVFDISPVVIDGRVESAVVNARDVGATRQAEHRLRETETELAHALRLSTMGEMALAIAHELHQPLAAVVNYAGACAELVRSQAPRRPEILAYLEQVSAQTLRAGEIIGRLRGFIEKKEPERVPLTLRSIIEQTAPLLEAEARHHGVELEFVLDDDPPSVLGDRVQLQQILVNLVKNAVEATIDNGARRRLVRIETDAHDNGEGIVEVRVSDSGPGMCSQARDQAFEPFYSTKPTGMGFGLSISRSIAEAHGGSLVLRNASSQGSTFCLALPTLNEEIAREQ